MIQVTKITPLDRYFRTFANPFIDHVPVPKAKNKNPKEPKRAPNKQTIKQPHQIELDRYKAKEIEGYEPLFKKLNEQYPVERRY